VIPIYNNQVEQIHVIGGIAFGDPTDHDLL
jgi:hypothetical protein